MAIEMTKRRLGKGERVANQIHEDLSNLIEPFLEDRQRRSDDHPIQATTVRSYRLSLQTFAFALATARNEDELREEVSRIIDEKLDIDRIPKPMKPSGVNVYIRSLNSFFSWCLDQGVIEHDVKVKLIATPKRKRPRILSQHGIDLLKAFQPKTISQFRVKAMALIILDAGLRAEESLQLRESDLELKSSRVWAYTKGFGDEKRDVALSSAGKIVVRQFLVQKAKYHNAKKSKVESIDPYLFNTETGEPLSYRNSLRDLKKVGKRLGFEWTSWHTFRRTFATFYIQSGGLLVNLQEILAHADIKTTLLYLGSSIEEIIKVHDQHSALAAEAA